MLCSFLCLLSYCKFAVHLKSICYSVNSLGLSSALISEWTAHMYVIISLQKGRTTVQYIHYRTVYYSYTVHMRSLIRARTYSPFISSVLNNLLAISTFILYIIFNRLTSCSRRAVGGDVGEHHKDRLRARGGGGAQAAARRDGARVHLRGRMSARPGHHPSRFPLFSLPSPLLSALSSSFRHLNFRAHPLSIPITADSC